MSKRDATISKKMMGYLVIVSSLLVVLAETVHAEELKRDPFADSRGVNDKGEYPSVLTMPEFETSLPGATKAPANTAMNSTSLTPGNSVKTPVVPNTTTSTYSAIKSPAASPNYSSRMMVLRENVLLSQGINQWAKESGYKMLWNSPKDYLIYSTITLNGASADEVLAELGKLFSSENYGLVIKFYKKNNVLLVDEQ